MKIMILAAFAAFAALSIGIGMANAQPDAHASGSSEYHAPPSNFYQNNWMSNSD